MESEAQNTLDIYIDRLKDRQRLEYNKPLVVPPRMFLPMLYRLSLPSPNRELLAC